MNTNFVNNNKKHEKYSEAFSEALISRIYQCLQCYVEEEKNYELVTSISFSIASLLDGATEIDEDCYSMLLFEETDKDQRNLIHNDFNSSYMHENICSQVDDFFKKRGFEPPVKESTKAMDTFNQIAKNMQRGIDESFGNYKGWLKSKDDKTTKD